MNVRKYLTILLVSFICILNQSRAQDSCHLRISLLTCSPGEELYSTFGHTAIRVKNNITGEDLVYNYGTFEFGPDFYSQFIRGKLLYYLSVSTYDEFMYEYQVESRSVEEQVFQLDCPDKQHIADALANNALPQNKYYRYDFLFDNCTTRARDIIARNTTQAVRFHNILPPEPLTFRDQIHQYLDAGKEYWSKLGIDILLGAKLDKKVNNQQAMFLPDYLLKGMNNAEIKGKPLVSHQQNILSMPSPVLQVSWFRPFAVFSLLLILAAVLSLLTYRWNAHALLIIDFLVFFTSGLAGFLILFMWFGTDHKVCQDNFNLIWALPTNTFMAFVIHRQKRWINMYFRFLALWSLLGILAWFIIPQEMNIALLPFLILILFRSYAHSTYRLSLIKKNAF